MRNVPQIASHRASPASLTQLPCTAGGGPRGVQLSLQTSLGLFLPEGWVD